MYIDNQGVAAGHPQPKHDLEVRYRNPGASEDLVIPVQLTCNVSDDVLKANVTENSSRVDLPWLRQAEKASSFPVLICGSGSSLRNDLDLIKQLKRDEGAVVVALNGAAKFLFENGVVVDYQIIADAREQSVDLIGPANFHLLASQVHPKMFDVADAAILFHVCITQTVDEYLGFLPDSEIEAEFQRSDFALIGSHSTVGGVSLGVAYALGFRDFHLFGFDSSHQDGAGHAFDQPMNADDPTAEFEVNGKIYRASFSMKQQADVLPRIIYPLEAEGGCTFTVHGTGMFPDKWNADRAKTVEQREADKYKEMWGHDEYRVENPGVRYVEDAYKIMGMFPGERLIDLGCGTGRASKLFANKGLNVIGVDITSAGLEDTHTANFIFRERPLWDLPMHLFADWGFCTDVMEHIPTDKVALTISNIAKACKRGVYFKIDFAPDNMGVLIGQPLHMTVKPYEWWYAQLRNSFDVVENKGDGIFVCRHRR